MRIAASPIAVICIALLFIMGNRASADYQGDSQPATVCKVTKKGGVQCKGSNLNGTVGNNSDDYQEDFVDVVGVEGKGKLQGIRSVSYGGAHTCALALDGHVYCWGYNLFGAVGNGQTSWTVNSPALVKGVNGEGYLERIVQLDTGLEFTCAVAEDTRVYCWGYNGSGQLGDGSHKIRTSAVAVLGPDGKTPLSGIRQVRTSSSEACALTLDGQVYCWSSLNSTFQSADSLYAQPLRERDGLVLQGMRSIAPSYYGFCGLMETAVITCWQTGYDDPHIGRQEIRYRRPLVVDDRWAEFPLLLTYRNSSSAYCVLMSSGREQCWSYHYPSRVRLPAAMVVVTRASGLKVSDEIHFDDVIPHDDDQDGIPNVIDRYPAMVGEPEPVLECGTEG